MKDFKAIFNTYSGKIKKSVGLKKEFGDKFIHGGYEKNTGWYYERMFFSKISSLNFLNEYLSKRNFSSVLEIGCSTGLLPKFMYEIFNNSEYTGLDLSEKSLTLEFSVLSRLSFTKEALLKSNLLISAHLTLILQVQML